jgi:NAD-dependent dihydropyrimidine dehydrogenase PreA subunit
MIAEESTWGLPRELIPWGPTVDPGRCRGSGECVRFCPNSVYELDAAEGRARVAHFYQCVVLCNNCVAVCPNGAISFPSQDEFLDRVQELRRQRNRPNLKES